MKPIFIKVTLEGGNKIFLNLNKVVSIRKYDNYTGIDLKSEYHSVKETPEEIFDDVEYIRMRDRIEIGVNKTVKL